MLLCVAFFFATFRSRATYYGYDKDNDSNYDNDGVYIIQNGEMLETQLNVTELHAELSRLREVFPAPHLLRG